MPSSSDNIETPYDLFSTCVEEIIKEKIQEIHNLFELDNSERIQPLYNTYSNLSLYQEHRSNQKIKDRINNLFKEFGEYTDKSEKAFKTGFAGNYAQSVFELIIAEFIAENGLQLKKMEKKEGQPDFIFTNGYKKYYLECTTINTSQIDQSILCVHKRV